MESEENCQWGKLLLPLDIGKECQSYIKSLLSPFNVSLKFHPSCEATKLLSLKKEKTFREQAGITKMATVFKIPKLPLHPLTSLLLVSVITPLGLVYFHKIISARSSKVLLDRKTQKTRTLSQSRGTKHHHKHYITYGYLMYAYFQKICMYNTT